MCEALPPILQKEKFMMCGGTPFQRPGADTLQENKKEDGMPPNFRLSRLCFPMIWEVWEWIFGTGLIRRDRLAPKVVPEGIF